MDYKRKYAQPYSVEYAKSNRSSCKYCLKIIFKETLRLIAYKQSMLHGGKDIYCYHKCCFFNLYSPSGPHQITNFSNIRYEEQMEIMSMIPNSHTRVINSRKRAAESDVITGVYSVLISQGDLACEKCDARIVKSDIVIRNDTKYNDDTKNEPNCSTTQNVPCKDAEKFYHLKCFQAEGVGCHNYGESLQNMTHLSQQDQDVVRAELRSVHENACLSKKMKSNSEEENDEENSLEAVLKEQSKDLFAMRDAIQGLTTTFLKDFLKTNRAKKLTGREQLLDRCADYLTFGALQKCQTCVSGDMIFSEDGYTCNGLSGDYSLCNQKVEKPLRTEIEIPTILKTKAEKDFFRRYELRVKDRILRPKPLTTEDEQQSVAESYDPSSVTTLTPGNEIDPISKLEDVAHVYRSTCGLLYSAILAYAEISLNHNNFYKLQILESNEGNEYWFFNAWGRIGSSSCDSKTEKVSSLFEAYEKFEMKYYKMTYNRFESFPFKKVPGKYNLIETDQERIAVEEVQKIAETVTIASSLPNPTKDLIDILFDVNSMIKTMAKFQVDMEKIPLGVLSEQQLNNAYLTLKDLEDLIIANVSREKLMSFSNKFFTLVPHNFGMNQAPVIDSTEMIQNKREMLDNLKQVQTAYSMLQQDTDNKLNPLDAHYEQLKTELKPLDRNSEEFSLIQKYVQNTHAPHHDDYSLEILHVFKVKRDGERSRFAPFEKLNNRQLLWHGSRTTNYVGILKNGLKIAPTESPITGYMFGKGIYFTDMVSKSANYCHPNPENNIGLMLLSEVALGEMHELTKSEFIRKLPEGKHSCKGLGKNFPDPQGSHTRKDGVVIPLGKAVANEMFSTELRCNEYIVYNIGQVNVQYLLKMKFNYR